MTERYIGIKFKTRKLGELVKDKQIENSAILLNNTLATFPEECLKGIAGNVSARLPDGIIISASGSSLQNLIILDDYCKVTSKYNDRIVEYYGKKIPSSETKMHQLIYSEREDVQFAFHIHIPNLEKLQLLNRYPITKRFFPYGTTNLAKEAVKALGSNDIVILKNHGIVVVGEKVEDIKSTFKHIII